MIYDLIIIGAGAAGLFTGASLPSPLNGLIIEKASSPGKKLLMSGAGQCNLTHGGSIKDFISHYGENGSRIRSILYHFNNQAVVDFFEKQGVPLFQREDGKVFPKSLQAQDILKALVSSCKNNGFNFLYSSPVTDISISSPNGEIGKENEEVERTYQVHCGNRTYESRKLIIASGGCSYPTTGSDGDLFFILSKLGLNIKPTKPALVPVFVDNYPYKDLSGISFSNAKVRVSPLEKGGKTSPSSRKGKGQKSENIGALLLTHSFFSGPLILNLSRYISVGQQISINYYSNKTADTILQELMVILNGNKKQLITALYEYFNPDLNHTPSQLPKRFLELICSRANIDPAQKASQLPGKALQAIVGFISNDSYSVSKLGGYNIAMVTSGGVSLEEISSKTLECKNFPGLYFAGEILDVDGDTGGYNLQFAFSSGHTAGQNSAKSISNP